MRCRRAVNGAVIFHFIRLYTGSFSIGDQVGNDHRRQDLLLRLVRALPDGFHVDEDGGIMTGFEKGEDVHVFHIDIERLGPSRYREDFVSWVCNNLTGWSQKSFLSDPPVRGFQITICSEAEATLFKMKWSDFIKSVEIWEDDD
jgi:hypothetical protein